MEGLGSTSLWSLSPAIDYLDAIDNPDDLEEDEDIETVHPNRDRDEKATVDVRDVLLIGPGDPIGILKTLSRQWRHASHRDQPLHFHVWQSQSPLYARMILLLAIALYPDPNWTLQEHAELFLEVYGNIKIRSRTEQYIHLMADLLTSVVCGDTKPTASVLRRVSDGAWAHRTLAGMQRLINVRSLKHRDRDDLSFTFRFWQDGSAAVLPAATSSPRTTGPNFQVDMLWQERLRAYYARRYDHRANVVDWEYHMGLAEVMPTLYRQAYEQWRESGIAFEVRASRYDQPNRTMATVQTLQSRDGRKAIKWGYFSDILHSPHVPLGVHSAYKTLQEKRNNLYVHTSQERATLNMMAILHELHCGTIYRPNTTPTLMQDDMAGAAGKEAKTDAWEEAKVICMPLQDLKKTLGKSTYASKFELAIIACGMAQHAADLANALRPATAMVIMESSRNLLVFKKKQQETFKQTVTQSFANNLGYAPTRLSDKHSYWLFQQRTAASSTGEPSVLPHNVSTVKTDTDVEKLESSKQETDDPLPTGISELPMEP